MTRAELEALLTDILDVCAKHRVELRPFEDDGIAVVSETPGDIVAGDFDRLEAVFTMAMHPAGAGGAVVRTFDVEQHTEERFMVRRRP